MAETTPHKGLTGLDIHTIVRWVVADAASLPTTLTAADLHKVAYTQDTKTYYGLVSAAPVEWRALGSSANPVVGMEVVASDLIVTFEDETTATLALPSGGGGGGGAPALGIYPTVQALSPLAGNGSIWLDVEAPERLLSLTTGSSAQLLVAVQFPDGIEEIRISDLAVSMGYRGNPPGRYPEWPEEQGLSGQTPTYVVSPKYLFVASDKQMAFGRAAGGSIEIDAFYDEASDELVIRFPEGYVSESEGELRFILATTTRDLSIVGWNMTWEVVGADANVLNSQIGFNAAESYAPLIGGDLSPNPADRQTLQSDPINYDAFNSSIMTWNITFPLGDSEEGPPQA